MNNNNNNKNFNINISANIDINNIIEGKNEYYKSLLMLKEENQTLEFKDTTWIEKFSTNNLFKFCTSNEPLSDFYTKYNHETIKNIFPYMLRKYFVRYMICFMHSTEKKKSHKIFFGIEDNGNITGLPIIPDDNENIQEYIKKEIEKIINEKLILHKPDPDNIVSKYISDIKITYYKIQNKEKYKEKDKDELCLTHTNITNHLSIIKNNLLRLGYFNPDFIDYYEIFSKLYKYVYWGKTFDKIYDNISNLNIKLHQANALNDKILTDLKINNKTDDNNNNNNNNSHKAFADIITAIDNEIETNIKTQSKLIDECKSSSKELYKYKKILHRNVYRIEPKYSDITNYINHPLYIIEFEFPQVPEEYNINNNILLYKKHTKNDDIIYSTQIRDYVNNEISCVDPITKKHPKFTEKLKEINQNGGNNYYNRYKYYKYKYNKAKLLK